ncbi:MAG: type I DNA topoisomerase [Marinilabiliales bacterium]|nr:MAG: type I DNA topoisomerase [Marinilabiliales bacterium]
MIENLVIVESPAKAKTIEKFLGKDFQVKSSFGHIRDLAKKNLGIEIEKNYEPQYIVPEDKKAVVKDLKKAAKEAKIVWLASDEDREGEAIAWHLFKVLELDPKKVKRIVFHEITKEAIQNAIKNPRIIDENLVNAQQARRVLDRLVGFELSPVLWKKVKPSLSAGRVQSVAVKLLVEREREILNFKSESYFKITGHFKTNKNEELKTELSDRIKTSDKTKELVERCIKASYNIINVVKKPGKKSPAAPFTTSTLQQEASRKLGFSVAQTMAIAQKLYESGKITYMRTDSVNLSSMAIGAAKNVILNEFGEKYLKTRNFKTKSKGAQEAHEAIRPTFMDQQNVSGTDREQRLYDLIWKRTIASQMSEAELEKTTITIDISNDEHNFIATGEVLKFDGFLKVYIESTDDESEEETKGLLPAVNKGENLKYDSIVAIERFTYSPPRYTEASLVKKLEELGIGRPSTYAPTISTIQNRGYVIKEDRPGRDRNYVTFVLEKGQIKESKKKEITGAEKNKLFPNDIGMVVTDFLTDNFNEILNYNFTASVEEEFDQIANGNLIWSKMIDKFYKPFHKNVENTLETSSRSVGERILGEDPNTGKPVTAKIGPYGPMVQIGTKEDDDKPRFASLQRGQLLETITLEEALELFKLPRDLGQYEDKKVVVSIGRFGPYIRHDSKFVSLKKEDSPYKIELDRAIELIEEKREKDRSKTIKIFEEDNDMQLLNGRWGPYIAYKKKNYRIPKGTKAEELTFKQCLEIIKGNSKTEKTKKTSTKNTVAKKTTAKKSGTKKSGIKKKTS